MFEELDERDRKAAELAEEYGFSSENPITVDWVMEHPEDAVEIISVSVYGGDLFNDKYDYVYPMYEKITGKQVGTEDDCENDSDSNLVSEEEDWPDYEYSTLVVAGQAETVVTMMNYWLFEDLEESDRKAAELAEEYGFSAENPITVDWVRAHPEEAVEIMRLTQRGEDVLRGWNKMFMETEDE